jgi:hypothetical protein
MKYLDYEVTELPDSVENLFCKPLDQNGEIQKASEMQMRLIFFSVTSNQEDIDEMYDGIKKDHMLLSILEDRLKKIGCNLDKASIILLSTACKTPGEAVMYSSYIGYKMKELAIDFLDIEKLCSEIFPNGFFTEKTLHDHWDLQKVKTESSGGSDNLLDYLKAYESIMK